jgi:hypothetical protein
VRRGGCVGLTTRASAAATTRGVRLVELRPPVAFTLELVHLAGAAPSPAAAAFGALARAH